MHSTPSASAPNRPVLELDDVGVTYPGGIEALKPQSLEIRQGEVTVLLGRSGAGKSTLLRALNLLVRPTFGSVTSPSLGTLNTERAVRAHRRDTGMVFQQHQLIGRQSALVNTLAGRLSRYSTLRSLFPLPRADRELALACLERVGLLDRALQRVDCLSGGQQQRVGVARALVMEPTLLLADEPVASLDPATSRKLLTLLRDICCRDGITLVVSLHQVEYAMEFADRIIALSQGEVIFDDSPSHVTQATLDRIYQDTEPPEKESERPEEAETSHHRGRLQQPALAESRK